MTSDAGTKLTKVRVMCLLGIGYRSYDAYLAGNHSTGPVLPRYIQGAYFDVFYIVIK